jgi:hypothetical protein
MEAARGFPLNGEPSASGVVNDALALLRAARESWTVTMAETEGEPRFRLRVGVAAPRSLIVEWTKKHEAEAFAAPARAVPLQTTVTVVNHESNETLLRVC